MRMKMKIKAAPKPRAKATPKAKPKAKPKRTRGVTIITATIRPEYIREVFRNYIQQKWPAKELIIILNKDSLKLASYRRQAKKIPNVRVFQLSQRKSLGECLNFGVKNAKYEFIAKFDDDDYYSPFYTAEAMRLFKRSKADIVGKRSIFFYFPHKKILLLRKKSARPYTKCRVISGATIMFRKKVFQQVKFARLPKGTDVTFLAACRRKGYQIYTTSCFNFAAMRRANLGSHTWKISEKELFKRKDGHIIRVKSLKKHIDRSLRILKMP